MTPFNILTEFYAWFEWRRRVRLDGGRSLTAAVEVKRLQTIGKALHVANSDPDFLDREIFYAEKKTFLNRFARHDGVDLQHIPGKECFTCGGSGWYQGYHSFSGDPWHDTCNRCYGSGWFKHPVWVWLDRFRICDFVFHTPRERLYSAPVSVYQYRSKVTGYVEHRSYSDDETMLAYYLLYVAAMDPDFIEMMDTAITGQDAAAWHAAILRGGYEFSAQAQAVDRAERAHF